MARKKIPIQDVHIAFDKERQDVRDLVRSLHTTVSNVELDRDLNMIQKKVKAMKKLRKMM